ncbi:MAG: hypothetical protein F4Y02_12950 [Chloroflexi bacterium]|nr:hypothetical protein [Chloroflexota bacterium]
MSPVPPGVLHAARVLQEFVDASEPQQAYHLLRARYPTSEAVLEHPSIQCGRGGEDGEPDPGIKDGQPWTSALGLICGLFGADAEGRAYIALHLEGRDGPMTVQVLIDGEYRLPDMGLDA